MHIPIVEDVCSMCTVYVKCVLCQYKEDDSGHSQESQQYDDHDTYTSPQRIVLQTGHKHSCHINTSIAQLLLPVLALAPLPVPPLPPPSASHQFQKGLRYDAQEMSQVVLRLMEQGL